MRRTLTMKLAAVFFGIGMVAGIASAVSADQNGYEGQPGHQGGGGQHGNGPSGYEGQPGNQGG